MKFIEGNHPWFSTTEELRAKTSKLHGGEPREVRLKSVKTTLDFEASVAGITLPTL